MATVELAKYIGRKGWLRIEGFNMAVEVKDVRHVWGRIDVLVSPVAGSGDNWVSLERVTLE